LLKPVNALSDVGFLVVVAAGAVVAVDAGAAGVDDVAAVVEAAAAGVSGAGEDIETILLLNWGTLKVLPPNRRNIEASPYRACASRDAKRHQMERKALKTGALYPKVQISRDGAMQLTDNA
jgi:hypothetical protein